MDSKKTHGHRLTDTHRRFMSTKKWKSKKTNNVNVVNAGTPYRECLYYPLDLEGVTLKG